jgi:hypothetical protein
MNDELGIAVAFLFYIKYQIIRKSEQGKKKHQSFVCCLIVTRDWVVYETFLLRQSIIKKMKLHYANYEFMQMLYIGFYHSIVGACSFLYASAAKCKGYKKSHFKKVALKKVVFY